jgi:hypothetical protein
MPDKAWLNGCINEWSTLINYSALTDLMIENALKVCKTVVNYIKSNMKADRKQIEEFIEYDTYSKYWIDMSRVANGGLQSRRYRSYYTPINYFWLYGTELCTPAACALYTFDKDVSLRIAQRVDDIVEYLMQYCENNNPALMQQEYLQPIYHLRDYADSIRFYIPLSYLHISPKAKSIYQLPQQHITPGIILFLKGGSSCYIHCSNSAIRKSPKQPFSNRIPGDYLNDIFEFIYLHHIPPAASFLLKPECEITKDQEEFMRENMQELLPSAFENNQFYNNLNTERPAFILLTVKDVANWWSQHINTTLPNLFNNDYYSKILDSFNGPFKKLKSENKTDISIYNNFQQFVLLKLNKGWSDVDLVTFMLGRIRSIIYSNRFACESRDLRYWSNCCMQLLPELHNLSPLCNKYPKKIWSLMCIPIPEYYQCFQFMYGKKDYNPPDDADSLYTDHRSLQYGFDFVTDAITIDKSNKSVRKMIDYLLNIINLTVLKTSLNRLDG